MTKIQALHVFILLAAFSKAQSSYGAGDFATENFSAPVNFTTPLTVIKQKDPSFGMVETSTVPVNFTLDTSGNVTGTGNYIDGAEVGELDIIGSDSQAIDIVATNLSADNGVTPTNVTCKYGSNAEVPCNIASAAPPGIAGTKLLVGLTVNTSGGEAEGTVATPSFSIDVLYN